MPRNTQLAQDILANIDEYVDNAAASAALAVGEYYYNTTSNTITKVTA